MATSETQEVSGYTNDIIGIKRFHFDGLLDFYCHKCNKPIQIDFDGYNIAYPETGERNQMDIECPNETCGHIHLLEFSIKALVTLFDIKIS